MGEDMNDLCGYAKYKGKSELLGEDVDDCINTAVIPNHLT